MRNVFYLSRTLVYSTCPSVYLYLSSGTIPEDNGTEGLHTVPNTQDSEPTTLGGTVLYGTVEVIQQRKRGKNKFSESQSGRMIVYCLVLDCVTTPKVDEYCVKVRWIRYNKRY